MFFPGVARPLLNDLDAGAGMAPYGRTLFNDHPNARMFNPPEKNCACLWCFFS